jgi:hypothetical protein
MVEPLGTQIVGGCHRLLCSRLYCRVVAFAEYCETDVVNTYRVWLRHELFRGRLTDAEF